MQTVLGHLALIVSSCMCLFLKTKLESSDKRKQGKTSEYPPQNPQSRFALFHRLPRMTFVLCSPMLFQMFQGPTTRCAFVVCCKGCKENIPAPVETLPSSWIAAKCPLCGEHRQYLPTEIFQGRVSYLALRKPVRAVTRSNDVWPHPNASPRKPVRKVGTQCQEHDAIQRASTKHIYARHVDTGFHLANCCESMA